MSSAQTRRSFSASGTSPRDDALREPLDDRGLADAGLADQHRVVLRAAREDLDHAADLLVASDHRVELSLLGRLGQVAAELLERLVAALGILRGDALPAAHLLDPRQDLLARHRLEREEQVLGRDVVVLELLALPVGAVEHARERGRDVRLLLAALDRRPRGELPLGVGAEALPVGEQLLVEQREQQVLGVISGLPRRRASSCAAATASWLLIVSLLKSIYVLFFSRRTAVAAAVGRGRGRAGTGDAPPRARPHLALHPSSCRRIRSARPRGGARARRRPG